MANTEKFDLFIGKRVLNKQLSSRGAIPVFSANVRTPFGYTDDLLITDFSVPSVLWGIDGDWMTSLMPKNKKFYPTDHCGVLRCKTNDVNPRYLAHLLEKEGKKKNFSRVYRASLDRVQGISFSVADRNTQDAFVEQVEKIESEVLSLETELEKLNGRISEVLRRNLA